MKQLAKRTAALLCIAVLILGGAPAAAQGLAHKEEVVYANLSHNGQVEHVYIVNSFFSTGDTQVVDYGEYEKVTNLTTTEPIRVSGDTLTFTAPKGTFYYQGDSAKKELPWRVAVRYTLDGQPYEGADLAGKSGRLAIRLDITNNPSFDPVYHENFALQLAVTLENQKCRNITAPDATIANAGKSKQLSYIVLPGKEKTFTITADVQDFEMDGILVNGIPLTLNIDEPDTSELKDQMFDLRDAIVQLDDGVNGLLDGLKQLGSGTQELSDGAEALRDAARQLNDGAKMLDNGLNQLAPKGGELAAGADMIFEMMIYSANQQLASAGISLTEENYAQVLSQMGDAGAGLLSQLQAADQYRQGVREYTAGVSQLAGGGGSLSAGVGQLADGMGDFFKGTLDINDAVLQLEDGVTAMADGTFEMREETGDLDTRMDDKISELLDEYRNNDFTMVSFASSKNIQVDSVQFTMRTADIKIPEVSTELPPAPKLTLWQRIVNLFIKK